MVNKVEFLVSVYVPFLSGFGVKCCHSITSNVQNILRQTCSKKDTYTINLTSDSVELANECCTVTFFILVSHSSVYSSFVSKLHCDTLIGEVTQLRLDELVQFQH